MKRIERLDLRDASKLEHAVMGSYIRGRDASKWMDSILFNALTSVEGRCVEYSLMHDDP